jgi:hypothetical protein
MRRPDTDELLQMPFALWYMWKSASPLMQMDQEHQGRKYKLYGLFLMEEAAEALIHGGYMEVSSDEPGHREYKLTEHGKRYCETLFGNKGDPSS